MIQKLTNPIPIPSLTNNFKSLFVLNVLKYIKISKFIKRVINSDFKFTSKLRRNKLFEFINTNTELVCSYEPCIYPGVKIQFFYNDSMDGICRCQDGFCSNKSKN